MQSVDFHAIDCTISRWLREEIMKGSWFAPLPRNTGGCKSKPFTFDGCETAISAGCGSGSATATWAGALGDMMGFCSGAAGAVGDFEPKCSSIDIEDQLDFACGALAAGVEMRFAIATAAI